MSPRIHKTISFELTRKDIDRAIREVKAFSRQITAWCNDLVKTLTEEGVTVAKMNVMHLNAVYTGELEESIQGVFFPSERKGIIFTDCPHALYVEFGTGIVGQQGPQHPMMQAFDWKHDIHRHGEAGWVYYLETDNVNQFRWTAGMASRPFMYNTLRWLEENAPRIAESTPFKE